MPTLTEIKYSQLENRFDSEYYKPEYLEVEDKLEKTKFVTLLKNVVKKSNKTFDPSKNITNYFYYIEIDGINLVDGNFSFAKLKNHEAPSRARKKLEYGDILISTVRPNRNAVSLFLEKSNSYVCSTGFCVIESEKINPYFLFIFLKTKYSVYQLIRNTSAAMYPAVSEDDILNIKIINPSKQFQLHIEKLVKEAFSKRNSADQKYEQAKQLLEEKLGLDKLKLKEEKTFETRFFNVKENMRFDSEYYHPKYTQVKLRLVELSNNYDVVELKKIASLTTGKQQETFKELTNGVPFYSIKDIKKSTFSKVDIRYIRKDNHEKMKNSELKTNDVLLAITGATIGKTGIFLENEGNISGDLARIRIKDDFKGKVDPFYILIYLESLFGQVQINRNIYGATNKHLSLKSVEKILISILPTPKQEQISKLIRESFDLRKESKALLNSARQKIEEMIENATWK
ncbi:MAG: restriction endonuclease subunit S [Candidatus Thermoplasmatota archaeon]|nr:restriction endonuclease subunit S [Candidatus Thermoplasmatota archaeon]MBU4256454.1 restriction endonuclease subunit S [Candidatus Thermoplasmatota archaeon]MCG2735687.1 restriction endonuclease subunit S [Candidatus Methanoperedenaceae archaeon]MCG2825252.1 restriction endonuclease subunit S [Thermoplasmatales archaeon]